MSRCTRACDSELDGLRQVVEERQPREDHEARNRRHKGNDEREPERRRAQTISTGDTLDRDVIRVGVDQAGMSHVRPDRIEQHARGEVAAGVHDHTGSLTVMSEVLGEQGGREREGADHEERREIQEQEVVVHPLDVLEDRVVVCPDDADDDEAQPIP